MHHATRNVQWRDNALISSWLLYLPVQNVLHAHIEQLLCHQTTTPFVASRATPAVFESFRAQHKMITADAEMRSNVLKQLLELEVLM
jgi:hypothetical protein